jgi:hypothetical protein
MQASLYQRMLGMKRSLILYMDRKYFGMHAFWYDGEPALADAALEKAKRIHDGVRQQQVPDRCPECLSAQSARAKACPYAEACFFDDANLIFRLAKDGEGATSCNKEEQR